MKKPSRGQPQNTNPLPPPSQLLVKRILYTAQHTIDIGNRTEQKSGKIKGEGGRIRKEPQRADTALFLFSLSLIVLFLSIFLINNKNTTIVK